MTTVDFLAWKVTLQHTDGIGWTARLAWPSLDDFDEERLDPAQVTGYTWRDLSAYNARALAISAFTYAFITMEARTPSAGASNMDSRLLGLYGGAPTLHISHPHLKRAELTKKLTEAAQRAEEIVDRRDDCDTPLADVVRANRAASARHEQLNARILRLAAGDDQLRADIWKAMIPVGDDARDKWLDDREDGVNRVLEQRAATAHQAQNPHAQEAP